MQCRSPLLQAEQLTAALCGAIMQSKAAQYSAIMQSKAAQYSQIQRNLMTQHAMVTLCLLIQSQYPGSNAACAPGSCSPVNGLICCKCVSVPMVH